MNGLSPMKEDESNGNNKIEERTKTKEKERAKRRVKKAANDGTKRARTNQEAAKDALRRSLHARRRVATSEFDARSPKGSKDDPMESLKGKNHPRFGDHAIASESNGHQSLCQGQKPNQSHHLDDSFGIKEEQNFEKHRKKQRNSHQCCR